MIRACVIGISGYGDTHYRDLMREREAGNAEIIAATVINQDQEKEKCSILRGIGCEIFSDHRLMLEKFQGQGNLCCIPTGIPLHAPMSIAAMRAGFNVYVEKPAAATIQEVRAMQACERETGRFVAVGYQNMYSSDVRTMKELILSGRIGKVKCIKCIGLGARDAKYYSRNGWAGRLKSGESWVLDSPYNNAYAHQVNILCFLAGTEFAKSARLRSVQAELYRANPIESADTATLRIITAEGTPLYFITSHAPEEFVHTRLVVEGERGSIDLEFQKSLTLRLNSGEQETFAVDDYHQLRVNIYRHLIARINNGQGFICDLDIAGTQTLCANGAHESSLVRNIGAEYVRQMPEGDSTRMEIAGLNKHMLRCFEERLLLSEAGAPWAVPAKVFDLSNYEKFTGPATR